MTGFIRILVRAYQVFLSPMIHFIAGPTSGCRFTPTCSQYCIEAVHLHGARKGLLLSITRICRCHPGGESGWDPVPPPNQG